MKYTVFAVLAAVALFLSACASKEPIVQSAPGASHQDPRAAVAAAVAECASSIERIATSQSGDAGSRVAAVGAIERLCGGQASANLAALHQQAPAQSPGLIQTLWTATLQAADLVLRGYGIKANRDVAVVNSNNNRDVALGSYSAFTAMGGSIERAGIAGYPHVQAPAPNNILSGTGVLGSGTYTGPVTTTTTTTTNRTCNGGTTTAGSGSTTGGAGGTAAGGQC